MIEEAIVALLTGNAGVGTLIADRLYPVVLPEDGDPTLSAATYQVVSDIPTYTLANGVAYQTARVQITAWSPTALAAKQLTAAIRAVLEQYSGTAGGVVISNAWIAGQMSSFEQDLRRQRVQTDYKLMYEIAS